MNIFFRYDDYSELSDTQIDLAVLQTLIRAGHIPLVGIIPLIADVNWGLGDNIPLRRLSQERIQRLKHFLPHVEIALHGYTHQAVTRYSGLFEFGDVVALSCQAERLADGKDFLEYAFGVDVNWFVPPWNSYGNNTLVALKQCGFAGVSADAAFGPVVEDLAFAPATALVHELSLFKRFAQLNTAGDIIVVLHDYDFIESGSPYAKISIPEFGQQLDQLNDSQVESGCWSQLANDPKWGGRRASSNQALRNQTTGLIRYLLAPGFNSVYWDEDFAFKKALQLTSQSVFLKKLLTYFRRCVACLSRRSF